MKLNLRDWQCFASVAVLWLPSFGRGNLNAADRCLEQQRFALTDEEGF